MAIWTSKIDNRHTFGSSLILLASKKTSSSDRVYLITSSGTDCRLQCLRSIHSTWRLQARNIGMHLNMAQIIHYGPFGNMWNSDFIPKLAKNMNICVLFRDLGGYIIGIRMLYIARDVTNYPTIRPSSAKGDKSEINLENSSAKSVNQTPAEWCSERHYSFGLTNDLLITSWHPKISYGINIFHIYVYIYHNLCFRWTMIVL